MDITKYPTDLMATCQKKTKVNYKNYASFMPANVEDVN